MFSRWTSTPSGAVRCTGAKFQTVFFLRLFKTAAHEYKARGVGICFTQQGNRTELGRVF